VQPTNPSLPPNPNPGAQQQTPNPNLVLRCGAQP